MSRHEFTMLLVDLLLAMEADGLKPFVDFVKRSDEEQRRLFLLGLSKCDGLDRVSQHQRGRAADIYLLNDIDKLADWDHDLAAYWHDWWVAHGGAPMLNWDLGHFEVR